MRRVPAPVTVVTATGAKEARGATIGSFTSVSLDPPLISFNLEQGSQMHEVMEETSHFAVHILEAGQAALCTHFARPDCSGAEQLGDIAYHLDSYGNPILDAALAILRCRTHARVRAGDHSIIIGEVVEVEERGEGTALLYHNRTYCSIERAG